MASKSVKGATKVARCRVCHRELKDRAAIAAGIGPVCATKAARRAVRSVTTPVYPADRMARIERNVRKLTAMLENASHYHWSAEDRANIRRWYGRWSRIQAQVAR